MSVHLVQVSLLSNAVLAFLGGDLGYKHLCKYSRGVRMENKMTFLLK